MAATFRRPFLAPEVIQISSMDCGVAALVCFLRGAGVHANYERMREACQTDVDGTSIDTLEDLVKQIGLECIQHLLPEDSFLEEAKKRLPVVAVTTTPAGHPHFSVLWRVVGGRWQVMDPARGRRWLSEAELQRELHVHTQWFEPTAFRAWAEQSSFLAGLQSRLYRMVPRDHANALLHAALNDSTWRGLASLDAAVRFVRALRGTGGRRSARWTRELLERVYRQCLDEAEAPKSVPPEFWSVRLQRGNSSVRGNVMLASGAPVPPRRTRGDGKATEGQDLQRALSERELSVFAQVRPLLSKSARALGWWGLVLAVLGVVVSTLEVLAIRASLSDLSQFSQVTQKTWIVSWLISLFGLLLGLEMVLAIAQRRVGRVIEIRLRMELFGALPSLDEHFIRSRPTSDLAQRAQLLHLVRDLPTLAVSLVRGVATLVLTLGIVAALDVWLAALVGASAAALSLIGFAIGKKTSEVELKSQANGAALLHVFQDALLGIVPLRLHGAELALRKEHRTRLVPWVLAQHERLVNTTIASTIQGIVLAVVLLGTLLRGYHLFPDGTRFVILLFWVFRIPMSAQAIMGAIQVFPAYRLALRRALEPIRNPSTTEAVAEEEHTRYGTGKRGSRVRFDHVEVVTAGNIVLEDVDLTVEAGEHVAIVGRSGAGKSTLLSLVLGLRTPTNGRVFVDGHLLAGENLHALRRQTAWIDPSVQLWNDTFLANLMYGQDGVHHRSMNSVLQASDLTGVVERLSEGLMTRVGSDGTLLSGGEGQRLRVGRALLNRRPRLALFDEPFRGLERGLRKKMLADAREFFCHETIIVVTHDVEHVADFDRVLVVEDGKVIEDDSPANLLRRESRFADLHASDLRNKETVWDDELWRRVRIESGVANESEPAVAEEPVA